MEEVKYINITNSMEDPKYTNCHMEDPTIRHHYATPITSSASASGGNSGSGSAVTGSNGTVQTSTSGNTGSVISSNCHSDDSDNMTSLIKEDPHNYSMPLPSFLH